MVQAAKKLKTLTVTVLRGGPSSEREVSLVSGKAVAKACRDLGHVVYEADIGPDDLSALNRDMDVCFPVLHGRFGEDGQVQRILEQRGIPYVGCDSACSAIAIDKAECKRWWKAAGLPTAHYEVVDAHTVETAIHSWQPPVVVKPVDQGSSVGVSLCDRREQMAKALRQGVAEWKRMMIEARLHGPEITVGILDDQPLPIIQIVPKGDWYDFHAKYHSDDTRYLFEVDTDPATYQRIQEESVKAFKALGGRDYARVDWILDRKLGPQLLEINTIPGFTDHSLLPKAAGKAGYSFADLVQKLLDLAVRRR